MVAAGQRERQRESLLPSIFKYMTKVLAGGAVFAFAEARIKAIAIVSGRHCAKDRPEEFRTTDNNRSDEGW
ncbi:hypothetical protein [Stenotrophomonas maltophilia]|uniref:hypothetical protein n=1 Tax=Stenotrophomonas maltophilia TaxID=40324 RepID=UPI0013DB2CBE|nr:hypothetical protein [Stenotrophomonas maltophilia]